MTGHPYLSRKIGSYFQISCLAAGLLLMLTSCAGNKANQNRVKTMPDGPAAAPDYRQFTAWAAHPAFYDYSDSLPAPLKPRSTDTTVDVFFLHPTSYLSEKIHPP